MSAPPAASSPTSGTPGAPAGTTSKTPDPKITPPPKSNRDTVVLDTKTVATLVAPKNCIGNWGPCDFSTLTQTYTISSPLVAGGKACSNKTGDKQNCKMDGYFSGLSGWFTSNMTSKNFMMLVFVLVVLAVLRGIFSTLREFFGGGGGGRVTVVS